ncbi:MAG: 4'-phosphopantetheinyl transferase superfamily protein [Bacteroidota bacterium]|nr:4'-phosphopantetheinyl transferase superfamily protein [Bacteroidota bacterium]
MPLIKEINTEANTRIGIWQVTESPEELKWGLQWGNEDIKKFRAIQDQERSMHWLGSRVLLRKMLDTAKFIDLQVDEYGKPYITNMDINLSISHSGDRVAIMLSDRKCGIDLQHIEKRIIAISHKFISDHEREDLDEPHLIEKMYVFWCGKEALYKLHGKRKLDFRQNLYLYPFEWKNKGVVMGEIKKEGYFKSVDIHYQTLDDYLLAYAVDGPSEKK